MINTNIIGLEKDSMLNGDGLRLIIWVAGCETHCKGCQNKEAQNRYAGHEATTADLEKIHEILSECEYLTGVTWLGGEPLESYNVAEVARMANCIKELHPDKTQWLYTGYYWEEVRDLEIMNYIDVLVDGPFIQEQADVNYHWAGSKNQRVIDVQESLRAASIIQYARTEMHKNEIERYRRCDYEQIHRCGCIN